MQILGEEDKNKNKKPAADTDLNTAYFSLILLQQLFTLSLVLSFKLLSQNYHRDLQAAPLCWCCSRLFWKPCTFRKSAKDCHGYGKTHGFSKTSSTGMGTVVDFSTLWHTVYLYHGIMDISWVYYNRLKIIFFFHIESLFFIVSQCDTTKYSLL